MEGALLLVNLVFNRHALHVFSSDYHKTGIVQGCAGQRGKRGQRGKSTGQGGATPLARKATDSQTKSLLM